MKVTFGEKESAPKESECSVAKWYAYVVGVFCLTKFFLFFVALSRRIMFMLQEKAKKKDSLQCAAQ